MKVLHIQTSMTPAGNAAYRLHLAMRQADIDSYIMTYKPVIKRNYVSFLSISKKVLISKAVTKLFQKSTKDFLRPNSYSYSLPPYLSKGIADTPQVKDADVIYLHWICGGFLSLKDIEELAQTEKPIFFFMHDMWTLTGGCHHSFSCDRYKSGCENCPMFLSHKEIPVGLNKKKKNLFERYDNLFFISPSKWMANCAKQSSILKNKPVYVIPNVVDEKIFKPLSKDIARKILNLPLDKKIIAFGCQATSNPFKGWSYLRDAINKLDIKDIHVVVYGSDYTESTAKQIKYPITFMGAILDEYVLSLIDSASDVFVSPSLAESFGLTFLENLLCGTPVVGFNNTAVPEIVSTGMTGYLAKNKDVDDLCYGIKSLLNSQMIPALDKPYSSAEVVKLHIQHIKDALKL